MEYYTPDIEDIRIGYECQIRAPKHKGQKFIIDEDQMQYAAMCIKAKILFTSYLTKEQIEAEGWIFKREYNNILNFETSNIWDESIKGGFLEYDTITKNLKITTKDGGYNQDGPNCSVKYNGKCPSINEFRYICKLLKI